MGVTRLSSHPFFYTMEYNLSTFLYPFSNDGKYYVVQTYTKRLFEINEDVYRQLSIHSIDLASLDNKTLEAFKDAQILTKDNEVERLEQLGELADIDTEWHTLHIIPTASCNFGCDYCFVLKDKSTNQCDKIISDDILYRGIDFFFNGNTSKNIIVTFYGGEPLLAPEVIYKTIDYISKHYTSSFIKKIVTNGTLITPQIADFLHKHGFDVSVSLDGNQEAHNRFRKYRNGKGTYKDVIKGIELLRQYDNSIKILMTVGSFNYHELPNHVRTLLDTKPTLIALNLPRALQDHNNGIEDNLDMNDLVKQYLTCVDMCYDAHIPEGHMADIIYGFLRDEVQYHPCHGCGKQIALAPNGMIGPCQAYLGTLKNFQKMSDFYSINDLRANPIFQKWKNISMFHCSKCRSCYLLPVCPGDCPYDWDNRTGSLLDVPEGYCITRKAMFDYMMHRIVSGKNIMFRHAPCSSL